MTEAIRIRPAAEADLPELVELLRHLFELEQDFEPDASKQQAGLSLMLESPFAELFVAECGGRVAGFCGVQLQISTAMGSYAAQIEDPVLHPEFRRRGIGSRLLDAAGAWAKQRGARRLQLHCADQSLTARRLSEARGGCRADVCDSYEF